MSVLEQRFIASAGPVKTDRVHSKTSSLEPVLKNLSVVIPCLNEEESIETCIQRIRAALGEACEILVIDNGSTDRSAEIAARLGARVVREDRRGYGAALLRGLLEARGDYLVMADADCTYDFEDARPLLEALAAGHDFAIGDRLSGEIESGAMPWAHRRIGTPILTFVLNRFYGTRVRDINCGLRALKKSSIPKLRLRSPGMEFASEMVIHARKAGLRVAEHPIRYYRRRGGEAKLRTVRDGWRHLRFILLFAPFYLYGVPAIFGLILSGFLFMSDRLGFQALGVLLSISSFQVFLFGLLARTFLWTSDSFIVDRRFGSLIDRFRLEYGILGSGALALVGVIFVWQFDIVNLIRGASFLALAVQLFFSSFLLIAMLQKKNSH